MPIFAPTSFALPGRAFGGSPVPPDNDKYILFTPICLLAYSTIYWGKYHITLLFTPIAFCGIIQVRWEKDAQYPGPPQERRKAMAVSKSQQKAVNKYVREKYDRINITMQKGKKDTLQAHAEAQGQSVNAYINTAIDERMSREAAGTPARPADAMTSKNCRGRGRCSRPL